MQAVTFFFAFVAVLALIGLAAWLVRRFAGNRLGANTTRGRMPRLAVIDAAAVDARRRLVLVRRDNIEHLLMIGGPTDNVVEPNIVRARPARAQVAMRAAGPAPVPTRRDPQPLRPRPHHRRRPRPAGQSPAPAPGAPRTPRAPPPPPEPPRRAPRRASPGAPGREPRPPPRPPEPRSRPSDPFAGLAADLAPRSEPPAPREPALR